MANKKLRVAILYGGTNTEHEVSCVSAHAVMTHLDPKKYQLIPIMITKNNSWVKTKTIEPSYAVVPAGQIQRSAQSLIELSATLAKETVDVVFPVLHGPYGEDGTIQGLLEMFRYPYVGCGVTGSAVCMDKVIQKNICRDYGIPIPPFFWLSQTHWIEKREQTLDLIRRQFADKYPLFVKPANQGSSVGITKVHNEAELLDGIALALTRDRKVLVEQGIPNAREIECAVLGENATPQVAVLGEIIPGHEFYDYADKYLDDKSQALIPAELDPELARRIQHTAKLAFEVLDCDGLARVDFLVDRETGEFFLSEVNTLPGFTPISMYPMLWEKSGISYSALLDRLITLALARHEARQSLNYSR
jgi:D-alanine-D-alanine ligase